MCSVADPECLSRILIFYPFRIRIHNIGFVYVLYDIWLRVVDVVVQLLLEC
jgi:hypothetical protein